MVYWRLKGREMANCNCEYGCNCQFGGPDGRRLFITATSTLWSLPVGIRGAVTPWVNERS